MAAAAAEEPESAQPMQCSKLCVGSLARKRRVTVVRCAGGMWPVVLSYVAFMVLRKMARGKMLQNFVLNRSVFTHRSAHLHGTGMSSNRIPCTCSRSRSGAPRAVAGVMKPPPRLGGALCVARHTAASATIFAVSS